MHLLYTIVLYTNPGLLHLSDHVHERRYFIESFFFFFLYIVNTLPMVYKRLTMMNVHISICLVQFCNLGICMLLCTDINACKRECASEMCMARKLPRLSQDKVII